MCLSPAREYGIREIARSPLPVTRTTKLSVYVLGAILTGTVLSGTMRVGDTIEIPALKVQKKVKSMQVFKKAVQEVSQGARVGVCVAQLEANLLERGLAGTPGHLQLVDSFLMCALHTRNSLVLFLRPVFLLHAHSVIPLPLALRHCSLA